MYMGVEDRETICAVSTPAGYGGISVIRLSGPSAYHFVRKLGGSLPDRPESHKVYYAKLRDSSNLQIDEVLVTFFSEGKSFTGDEVVEISCHGNPYICEAILIQLVSLGARPAGRGEFTFRAFMNGRMDLVQAEGVLSLIEGDSVASRRLAMRQLAGQLSKTLVQIEDELIFCLAHIEASIDFSGEGLATQSEADLRARLSGIESSLKELVGTFKRGRIIKHGIKVALVGRPNVGKSSLLNMVCQEEKAIVTPFAGTTRDLVSNEILFEGNKICFVDSAGLRGDKVDLVEAIGIEKSRALAQEADLVFFIFDLFCGLTEEDFAEIDRVQGERLIVLGNKADLVENPKAKHQAEMRRLFERLGRGLGGFDISAKDASSRERLLREVTGTHIARPLEEGAVLSQLRHFEELSSAVGGVRNSLSELGDGLGAEFYALGIREALFCIQRILGKSYDDQVLDRVFKEFCLGK